MNIFKKSGISVIKKAGKLLLFVLLFLLIYTSTRDILRNKHESEALGIIAKEKAGTYDVILAGPSHMQYAVHPSVLFHDYGIASCNTATAAQSLPTTYHVVKQMIDKHHPKVVAVDLFCAFYPDVFFTPTRFHQAIDNFPLSLNKASAIEDLGKGKISRKEFYLNYLLYHSRWKELTRADYKAFDEFDEKAQLLTWTPDGSETPIAPVTPYPTPFVPVEKDITSDVPAVSLDYLQRLVKLCKDTDTALVLVVIPYRADIDNNDTDALVQQQIYNRIAQYAEQWEVPFLNLLHHTADMGFDFNTDMAEYSHVNYKGAEKVSAYFGAYLNEQFDLPDRRSDKAYARWHADYDAYEQRKNKLALATDKAYGFSEN